MSSGNGRSLPLMCSTSSARPRVKIRLRRTAAASTASSWVMVLVMWDASFRSCGAPVCLVVCRGSGLSAGRSADGAELLLVGAGLAVEPGVEALEPDRPVAALGALAAVEIAGGGRLTDGQGAARGGLRGA